MKTLSAWGVATLCAALLTARSPAAEWPLTGALIAHDPTLIKEGDRWWCFHTGAGLQIKSSPDGQAWSQATPLFDTELPWWRTHAPRMGARDVWAPDLQRFNGRVWCFYAVSEFGTNNSAIGLKSCTRLAAGDWRDDGLVISSKAGGVPYNAIDPYLTTDAGGQPWLVFGSWFDGIQIVRLDPATMKPAGPVQRIAKREGGIEGPCVVYVNGFYYLFVSIDLCCRGVESTYKITYGRSREIAGPYVDRSGVEMLQAGGTLLETGGERWKGPGGQDVYATETGWVLARHSYDATNRGTPMLRIVDLYWDEDGWPSLSGSPRPTITKEPQATSVPAGQPVTLTVEAAGPDLTYQWQKDGADIAGANAPTLTIANAGPGDVGVYTVLVASRTDGALGP